MLGFAAASLQPADPNRATIVITTVNDKPRDLTCTGPAQLCTDPPSGDSGKRAAG